MILELADIRIQPGHQLFQSRKESAGFAGLQWMYDGIEPLKLFQ